MEKRVKVGLGRSSCLLRGMILVNANAMPLRMIPAKGLVACQGQVA
jgi:hypothetical protein